MSNQWNADVYQKSHDYVADYGKALLSFVPKNNNQIILDVGCGTGTLTAELSKISAKAFGLDFSPEMIAKAKQNFPHIDFVVKDATDFQYHRSFDVIFSNACFHWIKDHQRLLACLNRNTKVGGKLVCEFGGVRNIAKICGAFKEVTGVDIVSKQFKFYSAEEYNPLLAEAGFSPQVLVDYDRPTPLKDERKGLEIFIKQFFNDSLFAYSADEVKEIISKVENILSSELWSEEKKSWIADYRRLRVVAVKK